MKAYFIGIGGIGISALAQYYLSQGWQVFGSDRVDSEITQMLKNNGVDIFIGERDLKKIRPDLVIYSEAVPKNNSERQKAGELGIKTQSYAQALGELSQKYFTIAVAGAHGKSTTTAMIGLVLARAGLDPTVIVGAKVKGFGDSNFRLGKSKYLVIEACEYAKSFLNYWPKIAVITNIEVDHLECYGSLDNLVESFREFASHLGPDGILIANSDDAGVQMMINDFNIQSVINGFSLKQPEAEKLRHLLKIPGEHNIANGLAALAAARCLQIDDKITFAALADYEGAWRRFEQRKIKINGKNIILVVDYGHHPTQIKLTLDAAHSKWPDKKITCIFQPHQILRTALLFDQFVKVLQNSPIDRIFITDIYYVAGRENKNLSKDVDAEKLAAAINKPTVSYLPQNQILDFINKNVGDGEVIVIMGAGDIYNTAKQLIENESENCCNF